MCNPALELGYQKPGGIHEKHNTRTEKTPH